MPTAFLFNNADATAYADEYILPGTLPTGLVALYLFDRGATRSATNLATGGLQGAAFVGTPTINSDGTMTFSGGTTYLQTPIMQTVELTVMLVAYSLAPLAGEATQLFACTGGDPNRIPPNTSAGIQFTNNTASTAPDGKLTASTYWGPTGGPSSLVVTLPLDIPQWRTPSLLWVTAGSTEERTVAGSQTLGTSAVSALQSQPLYVNTTLSFRVGASWTGSSAGQSNQACWAYWNRVLTSAERAAFQAWISARLLRRHGYVV
jgi:hypothetical protein